MWIPSDRTNHIRKSQIWTVNRTRKWRRICGSCIWNATILSLQEAVERFSMISLFLDRIPIEHIGMKSSFDSELYFESTCSVRKSSRKRDISKKPNPLEQITFTGNSKVQLDVPLVSWFQSSLIHFVQFHYHYLQVLNFKFYTLFT